MKLSKIKKTIIRQYVCVYCGSLIYDELYGYDMCVECKEPIHTTDKFYCLKEGEHIHKKCREVSKK